MAYLRTQWEEEVTPLSADNMNNIEDGIEELQALKVDKEEGKGLSTNDYSTEEKNKLRDVLSLVYPVGSIYMSVVNTNPGTLFGGTWVAWGSGRVPVGVDTTKSVFDTVEETGGSTDAIVPSHSHTASFSGTAVGNHTHTGPSHTHTASFSGTAVGNHTHTGPSHTHTMSHTHGTDASGYSYALAKSGFGRRDIPTSGSSALYLNMLYNDNALVTRAATGAASNSTTSAAGTGATGAAGAHTPAGTVTVNAAGTGATGAAGAHTPAGSVTVNTAGSSATNANLQPYITCYMWKRTA